MTKPDIISFARKCVPGNTVPVRQVELARALLVAVDALEEIKKESDACHSDLSYGDTATEALAEIHSLPAL